MIALYTSTAATCDLSTPTKPTVRVRRSVPTYVRKEIVKAVGALCRVSPPRHRIAIEIVPHPCIKYEDGGKTKHGFGVFANTNPPTICVAGGLAKTCIKEYGDSREHAIRAVVTVLCHEWAHYEQHRDGKPIVERGVAVRTRTLLRLIGVKLPGPP
jgi:hypothetical protein